MGLFLPLASSRGTSASPLATRQNSPGIWTRRRCPKTRYLHYYTHLFFFPTPLDNVIPLASSTMETRLLHADKDLSHQQGRPCVHVLDESTRAKSRGGYLCGKGCVSIYPAMSFLPTPLDKHKQPFSSHMRHLRAEARSCTAG